MSEKIKTDAVLCALPDEWIHGIRTMLRNEGVETMDAHNREEMRAILQRHTFKGLVTVSGWLYEDEVLRWAAFSVSNILTLILVEPQHQNIPTPLRSLENPNHDWLGIPFDLEAVILRLELLGVLPRT